MPGIIVGIFLSLQVLVPKSLQVLTPNYSRAAAVYKSRAIYKMFPMCLG